MNKIKSLLYLCVALLCANLLPSVAKASHCAGGELTYTWLQDSTYQLTLHFYRDCSGSTAVGPFYICGHNSCDGTTLNATMVQTYGPVEVGTGCPGSQTQCANAGSTIPGYTEYIFTANVTLPSRCASWTFFTTLNARNPTNNLSNPGSASFYVDCTLDNFHAQGQSSPYFSVKPVPYVCVNVPYTYNNGAVDPNNDSLVYEMVSPRDGPILGAGGSGCSINPSTPDLLLSTFNLTNNPFPTGNTFVLNSTNGQLAFTPNTVGKSVITVKVKKYRNGILLGYVLRDIQIVVLSNCSTVQPTNNTIASTIVGATTDTSGKILGCAGQQLSFCFDSKSTDTGAKLVITSNNATIAPGSVLSVTHSYSDSVRTCFSWTPGLLDTGTRNLIITVKDSSCKPPGILMSQTFVIPIFISPITTIFKDTTICPGDSVQLVAIGGSTFTWRSISGSPISSLSCSNCKNPVARPAVTTRYEVTSNNLSYCNKNKDTVEIVVVTPAPINAGPDTTTCINNSLQLNINLTQVPGTNYHVQWTPATYLNNDTIPNPVTTPTNDVTYYIKVTPNGLGKCASFDTLSVRVLQGYKLFTPDTAICSGQSLNVNLLGDNRYNYKWTPANGVSDVNIMAPTIIPDTSHLYTVTASYPGCRDSVSKFFLDLQPVPTVFAGPDQTLCTGDTLTLGWTSVTPASYPNYSYSWDPGGELDNGTVPHPLFTASTSTTMTLTVSTPAGCKGTDDIHIEVKAPKFINVSADTLLCPGDTAQLHVTGDAVSVAWHPYYYISDTSSYDPFVYPVTSTNYTVIGKDKDNCADTASVLVTVKPAAVIDLPDTTTIYPGESYHINPGGNCLYFSWFPPLGLDATNISNPVATPPVNTRYFVTATTEFGCSVQDSIDIFVSPDSYIDVPNAFSPGNGPNNTIMPVHRGNVTLKSFTIFNRWGAKMFESSDINSGWDGRWNGQPQPMGVYVYIVEAVTPTGRRFYKQGNITLLR